MPRVVLDDSVPPITDESGHIKSFSQAGPLCSMIDGHWVVFNKGKICGLKLPVGRIVVESIFGLEMTIVSIA